MDIQLFTEEHLIATEKWHEYNAAMKKSGNPLYKDLAKVYQQTRNGKSVIDIVDVFKRGGFHPNGHPKLAIAPANSKVGNCLMWNSTMEFKGDSYNKKTEVSIDLIPQDRRWIQLKAPVPMIPPRLLPPKISEDHYILWEVDKWEMVPPVDPWLLERITKTMFVVLAAWDLTPLERACMAARI